MSFKNLGLSPAALQGVDAMGYVDPTPIQLRAIPPILEGRDLIGSAQTGTGKTAAFALPIVTRLAAHEPGGPRVLILEPTRELAAQVETAFRDFGRFTNLRVAVIHGGVGYGKQREAIAAGLDIMVATPGRLMDFLKDRSLRLGGLKTLILDEVDRMLDMGFIQDVRQIISVCPKERQTLFFSATVPPEIEAVAKFALRNPARAEVGVARTVNTSVTHAIYTVPHHLKFLLLESLLEKTEFESVIVFSRTKHGADRIARRLKAANHSVAVLHANRSHNQRVEALEGFKHGKYEVMVATDIAARGIDVAGVSHVINYDVPANPEDYVHRIGRTGRAQAVGDAFTLATPEEADEVRAIERFIGQKIVQLRLDGFDYTGSVPPPRPEGVPAGYGGGRSQQGGGGRGFGGGGGGGGGGRRFGGGGGGGRGPGGGGGRGGRGEGGGGGGGGSSRPSARPDAGNRPASSGSPGPSSHSGAGPSGGGGGGGPRSGSLHRGRPPRR